MSTFELSERPPQPADADRAFTRALRTTPVHQPVNWTPRQALPDEARFASGLHLDRAFPAPHGRLDTAFADFAYFLKTVGLPTSGPFELVLALDRRLPREAFRLHVKPTRGTLSAADTEGIRRGLIWMEDEMLRRGGPFLPLGIRRRHPLIRTRLSRCFYGPVNRPPRSRDELADEVDYYPREYLNRLAHEGVNGLWFTVSFFRTVPSRIIPQYGREAGPRLDKLRRTVEKCARFGIRIYPFCIEPAAFTWPYPELEAARQAHPDLVGHQGAFCTSTEKGLAYLVEATQTLFSEVPDLGGLIVIPVGERLTHCYSGSIAADKPVGELVSCPRCAPREPWEVLADTLAALQQGMRKSNPEAELVAWPYGQSVCWGAERTAEAAAHMPPGVILQHNFETGGHNRQLGRLRPTWDYWLSYVGPSELFERCARAALPGRVSAKLQVSCSHEVATTQVVPAPGLLFRKYRAMRRLGVSAAMHSWYFGTYPSLMTRAAGELSFAPVPRTEKAFLQHLARREWGDHADTVVEAWQLFARAYACYPTAHIFGYFGPMHDGPAWPLYLIPRRLPLAPSWQLKYPPSGDYIAECITNGFTLTEKLELCRRMSQTWERGRQLLETLRPQVANQPERLADIDVATALDLQFRSGYQILRFYAVREQLADARRPAQRRRLLSELRVLVRAEQTVSAELLPLARRNACLGYHSEAEGYKYYPALLEWRMRQLEHLLTTEFLAVEACVEQSDPLFPHYTGAAAEKAIRQGLDSVRPSVRQMEGGSPDPLSVPNGRSRSLEGLQNGECRLVEHLPSGEGRLLDGPSECEGRSLGCLPNGEGRSLERLPAGPVCACPRVADGADLMRLPLTWPGANQQRVKASTLPVARRPEPGASTSPSASQPGVETSAGPAAERPRAATWPTVDQPEVEASAPSPSSGQHWQRADWQECRHWLRQTFDRERWQRCPYDRLAHHPVSPAQQSGRSTRWSALHDGQCLFVAVHCSPGVDRPGADVNPAAEAFSGNQLRVLVEAVRTEPRTVFQISPQGAASCIRDDGYIPREDNPWKAETRIGEDGWWTMLCLPLDWLRPRRSERLRPLRLNVVRSMPLPNAKGPALCSWARQEPAQGRLVWGTLNPATDFGWAVLGE